MVAVKEHIRSYVKILQVSVSQIMPGFYYNTESVKNWKWLSTLAVQNNKMGRLQLIYNPLD